jgi:hypothetical protein
VALITVTPKMATMIVISAVAMMMWFCRILLLQGYDDADLVVCR